MYCLLFKFPWKEQFLFKISPINPRVQIEDVNDVQSQKKHVNDVQSQKHANDVQSQKKHVNDVQSQKKHVNDVQSQKKHANDVQPQYLRHCHCYRRSFNLKLALLPKFWFRWCLDLNKCELNQIYGIWRLKS